METKRKKAAASNTTKKCGSWIKRFFAGLQDIYYAEKH
jgi:hypothetical protein